MVLIKTTEWQKQPTIEAILAVFAIGEWESAAVADSNRGYNSHIMTVVVVVFLPHRRAACQLM